ncbi:helix-turn-helix protein [Mariprofundus aestuarium]|uniref:Helix-turn-helix protein n=1 Tax=Mariprofundus aestuarium TaxID=1921086 RepID=A0A2K8L487_MARES|nr:helix-turn-helix transcriptional regulator [Mariprofundus aestuarium]ATX80651.1 helix-turn-helix protein [Mariprofundus aestuarium]
MSDVLGWYDSLDDDIEYKAEAKKIDFACDISRRMNQLGMSKSDLAHAASTSNAYITKVLRGESNLTIESLVKFTEAVDGDLHIHISPKNAHVRWSEVITGGAYDKSVASVASVWVNKTLTNSHEGRYEA